MRWKKDPRSQGQSQGHTASKETLMVFLEQPLAARARAKTTGGEEQFGAMSAPKISGAPRRVLPALKYLVANWPQLWFRRSVPPRFAAIWLRSAAQLEVSHRRRVQGQQGQPRCATVTTPPPELRCRISRCIERSIELSQSLYSLLMKIFQALRNIEVL